MMYIEETNVEEKFNNQFNINTNPSGNVITLE